jgi:hypothetical protein
VPINAATCLRLEEVDGAAAERLIAGNADIEQDGNFPRRASPGTETPVPPLREPLSGADRRREIIVAKRRLF